MLALSLAQRRSLLEDGFVLLPNAVDSPLVDEALLHVNHWVGKGMDQSKVDEYWKTSFAPELRAQRPITDLYHRSSVRDVCEELIGDCPPPGEGQIALRFPSLDREKRDWPGHVDGLYPPSERNPHGRCDNFTAVVGVQLSDLPRAGMGNLAVWPGSHRKLAAYFRDHGPASLHAGLPPLDFGERVQLTAAPGDAVVMHYQLVHGITINRSPHVRHTVYFRLKHAAHDADPAAPMFDPWLHWPGLHDLATPADRGGATAARPRRRSRLRRVWSLLT